MGLREAKRAAADRWLGRSEIVAVYVGEKVTSGRRTGKNAVIFGVRRKVSLEELLPEEVIPASIDSELTDVVEVGEIKALGLTEKRRPCPGGYSVGHYAITAGTLGAWVKRGASELWHILSNNHVLADSNAGKLGDEIRQPGAYDGGTTADQIAGLTEYARIRFEGEQDDGGGGDGGGKKKPKMLLWRLAKFVPNAIARVVGCEYRLSVSRPLEVAQPYPNLVDAAIATPLSQQDVLPEVYRVGPLAGIRDLKFGDRIHKVGRTTDYQDGEVIGTEGEVLVDYGGRRARFAEELLISPGGFSAGGDSGSVILTEDNYIGGLLFAGSPTITIANKISNVVAILGVRLTAS